MNLSQLKLVKKQSRVEWMSKLLKSHDDWVRFDAMKIALTTNILRLKTLDSGKTSCFEGDQRTLPGIEDMQ